MWLEFNLISMNSLIEKLKLRFSIRAMLIGLTLFCIFQGLNSLVTTRTHQLIKLVENNDQTLIHELREFTPDKQDWSIHEGTYQINEASSFRVSWWEYFTFQRKLHIEFSVHHHRKTWSSHRDMDCEYQVNLLGRSPRIKKKPFENKL